MNQLGPNVCPVEYDVVDTLGPQTELIFFSLACPDTSSDGEDAYLVEASGYLIRQPATPPPIP